MRSHLDSVLRFDRFLFVLRGIAFTKVSPEDKRDMYEACLSEVETTTRRKLTLKERRLIVRLANYLLPDNTDRLELFLYLHYRALCPIAERWFEENDKETLRWEAVERERIAEWARAHGHDSIDSTKWLTLDQNEEKEFLSFLAHLLPRPLHPGHGLNA